MAGMYIPPTASPAGPPGTPAEASLREILRIARTIALILAFVAGLIFVITLVLTLVSIAFGNYGGGLVGAGYWLFTAVVNFLIWQRLPEFELLAAQRQYSALKDRLLLWIVLGILCFVIVGVLLLIAHLKSDALNASSPAAPPATSAIPAPPPNAPPPPVAVAPSCPRCGRPTALILEYGRYYCHSCGQYV
jgi:hypothetical protein